MAGFYRKTYYIDFDEAIKVCQTDIEKSENENNDEPSGVNEINIFKYELMKMCLDRFLNDFIDDNEEIDTSYETNSYEVVRNTLIKYGILNEYDG